MTRMPLLVAGTLMVALVMTVMPSTAAVADYPFLRDL